MGARGSPVAVAVFVSGAVLLGLEIAASRVLAPYGTAFWPVPELERASGLLPAAQTRNWSPAYRLREALRPRLHVEKGLANLVLLATDRAAPTEAHLSARWRAVRTRRPTAPDLAAAIRNRLDDPIRTAGIPTLDDYAPTDALLLLAG